MELKDVTFEINAKPTITVDDTSEKSFNDAILKTKTALKERMFNIIDYYCEQISLLDRFSVRASEKSCYEFWSELMKYAVISFNRHGKLFEKVYGKNDFDCYAVLINYDEITVPWPDGYKEPEQRINGLAPIGLNDDQFFFAECGILYELDFGSCSCKETKLNISGEAYNKHLEAVAIENSKRLNAIPMGDSFKRAMATLIRAKHGNSPDSLISVMEIIDMFTKVFHVLPDMHKFSIRILNEIDNTTTHFPQRFSIFYDGKPITLEKFFDIINEV